MKKKEKQSWNHIIGREEISETIYGEEKKPNRRAYRPDAILLLCSCERHFRTAYGSMLPAIDFSTAITKNLSA
jgi:hypothetical protein